MTRRRRSELVQVGRLVSRVLADLGLDAPARVVRVAERWEEAVGAEIARVARPTAMRRDTLELSVESSVWAQQLQLRKPELLAALRRVLEEDAPADLWFKVG